MILHRINDIRYRLNAAKLCLFIFFLSVHPTCTSLYMLANVWYKVVLKYATCTSDWNRIIYGKKILLLILYFCVCGLFFLFLWDVISLISPYISIFIMLHKNLKRSNKQVSIKSWVSGVLQFSGCYATTTGSFMPDWKIHFLQVLIIDNFTRTTEIATTLKLLTHQQQSGIISD